MISEDHTFDRTCPACRGQCDHSLYSRRRIRFLVAHREAYLAAYINPNPSSASNELERMAREYRTLPPRHACSCNPMHCVLCKKLAAQRPTGPDVAAEIGRGSLVNAPMPLVTMLDLRSGYAA